VRKTDLRRRGERILARRSGCTPSALRALWHVRVRRAKVHLSRRVGLSAALARKTSSYKNIYAWKRQIPLCRKREQSLAVWGPSPFRTARPWLPRTPACRARCAFRTDLRDACRRTKTFSLYLINESADTVWRLRHFTGLGDDPW